MHDWSVHPIRIVRRLVPLCLCFLIAIVSVLPIGTDGTYQAIGPMLVFAILFAWLVARPDDIPPWSAFMVGLAFDGLGSGPLGLWSLSFVVGYVMASSQLETLLMLPRFVAWVAYAVISGLTAVFAWGVAAAYLGSFVDPLPILMGCAVSIAASPILIWIGGRPVEDDTKRFGRI